MMRLHKPGPRSAAALLLALLISLAVAAPTLASQKEPISASTAAAARLSGLEPTLQPSAAAVAAAAAVPQASASATCNALILSRDGKLVTLKQKTYKYAFVRIKKGKNKGKFKRVIRRVSVPVRVSCTKQCVKVAKKKGKYVSVYKIKKVKVKVVKRGRIVTVKRRARVYSFTECSNLPSAEDLGIPVKITVLPGSYALLDFGAFTRQAGVTGVLRGFIPGAFKPNTDVQITLTTGNLSLSQTPVFIDDACNNSVSSAIRTGNPTRITLDPTKTSTSTLLASGTATAIAYTIIDLPLELRNEDTGCNDPYITTGYSEFRQTFFLRGKVGAGGLAKLQVASPPDILGVIACLAPGVPTQPCNGFQVPIPILVSTKLTVAIDLTGGA